MGEGGVRETWGGYAAAFASEGSWAEERDSLRRLVELCALPPGALVVDVGSGAGYTGFAFARAGARVILSDPTHEMLLAGRDGWGRRDLPHDPVALESWAEELPFRDGSVDAVVAHRAPHQFADVEAFVLQARRVLGPGGVLGCSDQSPPDGWEQWHDDVERERDPTHAHAMSPREWRLLVQGAGLRIRATDVVYQEHDLEEWLDRVSCPEERRRRVRRAFEEIPAEIADVYRPRIVDGRMRFRTPQHVVVAVA